VLLAVLVVVLAYAWHDVHSRHARRTWDHTLSIAIVVLRADADASGARVDDASIDALRGRAPALEARLTEEIHRYRPSAPKPFELTIFGPIDGVPPPPAATGDGIVALASHEWDLRSWTRDVDQRANLAAGAFDSRVYVTVHAPRGKRHMVEGASEQGGRVGTVTIDLDAKVVDFALAVIAHELFHTLGALDHYDDAGNAKFPEGYAQPDLVPRVPQRFVEIMTRGRPVAPGKEETLDTLDDLAVGPATAREIGWSQEE